MWRSIPPRGTATPDPLKEIDREQNQNDHYQDSNDGHGLIPPLGLSPLFPGIARVETLLKRILGRGRVFDGVVP
jgi:hypothetical protein